jgi:chromosome segregation ATPase
MGSGKHNLSKLDEEIGVMTTTRDLLTGQIPDFIDIEEFPSLQSTDRNVEEYTGDVKDAMEKMKSDISSFKKGVWGSRNLEKSLTLEKEDLASRLEALGDKIKPDVDKDNLGREVAALSEQKKDFASEIAAHQDEISRIRPAVTAYEKKLEIERESDLDLDKKVRYLTERKQFISTLDDVEVEMEKLKDQIAKSNMDFETNNRFQAVINKVNGDMEAIGQKTAMSLDVCIKAQMELQSIVLLGHGILYGGSSG